MLKKYIAIFVGVISLLVVGWTLYKMTHVSVYESDRLTGLVHQYDATTFPYQLLGKDFLFGVSTAAPQIEEIFSKSFKNVPYAPNTLTKNYIDRFRVDDASIEKFKNWQEPGESCMGYSQAKQLVDLARDLGCNAYRFTIEWSRVNPEPGVFVQDVIDHYAELAQYVRQQGMVPMVFLHHYVDPIWFMDQGGFESRENVEHFKKYCRLMIDALSPHVDMFVVFNQPAAYARKGYIAGGQMPFIKNKPTEQGTFPRAEAVLHTMLNVAVGLAEYIHTKGKLAGVCHQYVQAVVAKEKTKQQLWYAANFERYYNQLFLQYFKDKQDKVDFVAWQYYARFRLSLTPDGDETVMPLDHELALRTDDGFRFMDEEGFYNSLEVCAHHFPDKKIYVTENGCNTTDESYAINFLNKYLSALFLAKKRGINVCGYFYWTLIDNYEWGRNFTAHFGMYTRLDRQMKERGQYYKKIIHEYEKFYKK
ncbi:glycoside hydrolase family 1 protein [Candidatus Babeliales bacterium]|nr:glycoside hydrolase family 1 protein [Candidatus Babeliales bacterium]